MKNTVVFLVIVFGLLVISGASCSNENEKSSNDEVAMDSVIVSKRANDELALSTTSTD